MSERKDKTPPRRTERGEAERAERQRRLARAMRRNLVRRKAQREARKTVPPERRGEQD
jgi:hypothetical protein